MKIYRIQNEYGVGMYGGGGFNGPAMSILEFSYMRHPDPWTDSGLSGDWNVMDGKTRESYSFGFASIAQMRNWVYDDFWFDQLSAKGFYVYEFEVLEEAVILGNTQAIYVRNFVQSKRKMTIEEVVS